MAILRDPASPETGVLNPPSRTTTRSDVPTPTTQAGDRSKFRKGGKGGTLEQRAREVTEELRRRLGDPARPQDELNTSSACFRRIEGR